MSSKQMCKISFTVQLKNGKQTEEKREREIEKEWVLGRERDEPNPTTDTWINIGQLPGHIIDLVDLQYAILLLFSLSLFRSSYLSLSVLDYFRLEQT